MIYADEITRQQAYCDVFGTALGRDVLRDILIEGGIFKPSLNSDNPHTTAFNEGRRNFALQIAQRCNLSAEDLLPLPLPTPIDQTPKKKPTPKKRTT